LNVFRTVRGFEMTAGYSKPGGKAAEPDKEP
jgi:hypothetical protein